LQGLSSLLLAQDPNRTPDDIRSIIRNTSEDQVGDPSEDIYDFDNYYGYGRINANQALLQSSLSNDEYINPINLSIYPNPVVDKLFIQGLSIPAKISVYNLLGKLVFSKTTSSEINLNNLQSGIYIVKIVDNQKEIVRRFIKN